MDRLGRERCAPITQPTHSLHKIFTTRTAPGRPGHHQTEPGCSGTNVCGVSDVTDTTPVPDTPPSPDVGADLDLDAIEADLDGVQVALGRLADGHYWIDEVTGGPIPDDVLAANPTARRVAI
ncbi:MAG: hypothetical protein ACJAXA_000528 [Candidatus Aldehydirespiratoraceae bacterium]|jgi:hypothetical protein